MSKLWNISKLWVWRMTKVGVVAAVLQRCVMRHAALKYIFEKAKSHSQTIGSLSTIRNLRG